MTLKYESDGYVATRERKQGAFCVGCLREKKGHWVWDKKKRNEKNALYLVETSQNVQNTREKR